MRCGRRSPRIGTPGALEHGLRHQGRTGGELVREPAGALPPHDGRGRSEREHVRARCYPALLSDSRLADRPRPRDGLAAGGGARRWWSGADRGRSPARARLERDYARHSWRSLHRTCAIGVLDRSSRIRHPKAGRCTRTCGVFSFDSARKRICPRHVSYSAASIIQRSSLDGPRLLAACRSTR